MITIYWVCTLCGEAGKILIQFSACTPLDPDAEDMKRARALAPSKINHEHKDHLHILQPI